jgi:hypothetical protein
LNGAKSLPNGIFLHRADAFVSAFLKSRPFLRILGESKQDAKSKAAAATQSENDPPRNPATPASSAQSAK